MGIITLTTDFGGHYLGMMKAAIRQANECSEIIELSSEIGRFDVRGGAFVLLSSYEFFPRGTVHLAVVDPGVGSRRRAIAVRTKNYTFVGPDNGLLSLAACKDGVESVRELSNPKLRRDVVAPTFHGRDIFAPAAAYLAAGGEWEALGGELDGLEKLQLVKRFRPGGKIDCEVVFVDGFGNLTLSIADSDAELRGDVGIVLGKKRHRGKVVETYEEGGGGLSVLLGSAGYYEVAKKRGSAAAELKARPGDVLTLVSGAQAP